ncbi:TIM barrel protein [Stieleria sp. TO1_6]|uniref:sugar phosphate isomerase/epimerase family protein n=1 Tax=Stieleria tagensis TaxID=2956795 RepID=UPI00209AED44|nr:sugar phosphate isomerase/epimerase family protein [Stieleria tagensis]MCO8121300.1 TIM barrel protein [Stieleria tagensis]
MIDLIARRQFLRGAALTTAGVALARPSFAQQDAAKPLFEISLAQWSLNRQFFGFLGRQRGAETQKLDPQDFAKIAKQEFGINAIEYVNQFYADAVHKPGYLQELKKRADDEGVRSVLIMCDGEGNLGDPDTKRRITSVRNHIKWLEWAQALGCHSIRVNARSDDKLGYHEQMELAADGLRRLCEIGDTYDLNVIVENHGGLSSHGRWLAGVMEKVDHPRCGTLPDFGNFRNVAGGRGRNNASGPVTGPLEYDRYLGTYELMPYAKGASAKTHAFDEDGNETSIDYKRMLNIVCDPKFNFSGDVGIEFEGGGDSFDGIKKTKALLERVRDEISA